MMMVDEVMTDAEHKWAHPSLALHLNEDYIRAISACVELGNMLGICEEAREKVVRQVLANSGSTPIPVLKVTIGFSPRDAVCYLGSMPGGQKFLALVCALVTAFDPSESARVLATLMQHHLVRELWRPTAEQLYPLIDAIDSRCQLSRFAEHIVHYELIFSHELRDRNHDAASWGRLDKTPDVEAMVKLVDLILLLQTKASKDRMVKAISIHSGRCAPWIAAFLRCWFHKESLAYIEMHPLHWSKPKQGQTKTNIGIKLTFPINKDTPECLRIRGLYSETDWDEWKFGLGRAERYGGLVRINTYFRLMLCAFRLDIGQANKAAVEVIPFALTEARKGLTMCSEGCVSRGRWGAPCEITTDIAGAKLERRQQQQQPEGVFRNDVHGICSDRFEPFPERGDINKVLQLIPGCEKKHMQDLRSKDMGKPIYAQREVSAFLNHKKYTTELKEWEKGKFQSQSPLAAPSPTTTFVEQIAHVVATILALSLFHSPEELLVSPNPFVWKSPELRPSTVISAICRVFRKQKACCDVMEWHHVGRKLAGEKSGEEQLSTILSGCGGQTVWPDIVFSFTIPKDGESYLQMSWTKGNIYDDWTQHCYRKVLGIDSRTKPSDVPRSITEIPSQLTASNMSPAPSSFRFTRDTVSQGSDGLILQCGVLCLQGYDDTEIGGVVDPCGALKSLASAERLEECPHDHDTPMEVQIPMDIDIDIKAAAGMSVDGGQALPDVYLVSPGDALPWIWSWACRANHTDAIRRGLGELLEYARSKGNSTYRPGAVAAVPVAGEDTMRFFALAKPVGAHVAVRKGACIACCVRFCREFGFDILVL